jgi:hypothetical protein
MAHTTNHSQIKLEKRIKYRLNRAYRKYESTPMEKPMQDKLNTSENG